MITIKRSTKADTRTCDVSTVSSEELIINSLMHINDVDQGMNFFARKIKTAGMEHDWTKIQLSEQFYDDFQNGFKDGHRSWWELHQEMERHHLKDEKYVQEDVNLIDIIEMITDGVMAGLARSGEYRKEEISDALLRKAFDNTIKLLLDNVKVEEQ